MTSGKIIRQWTFDAPFGPLELTATNDGLSSIGWMRRSPEESNPDVVVDAALTAYFSGELDALEHLKLDLSGLPAFRMLVLDALRTIDAGDLRTYGDIARQIDRDGANRAVGQAVGSNPLPIVVPCHRVVASDGTLGGYSGGLDQKRWLLKHEGHEEKAGGWYSYRAGALT